MRALFLAAAVLVATTSGAHAEKEKDVIPWYRGPYAKNRITHMAVTAAFAATYVTIQYPLNASLSPTTCRWCSAPGFDTSLRNSIHWNNVNLADSLSTYDAYIVAPIIGLTFLYFSDKDASWRRLIDDTIPVFETVAISQVAVQVIKLSVARQRPYARFGDPTTTASASDYNTSFVSGHSALGFGITVSAGMICHWRHYWTEPYVWALGTAISLSTEYLRMAADKHYLTDVLAGGLVGAGFGFTIPRLMQHDVQIVPVPNGAAVVGMF